MSPLNSNKNFFFFLGGGGNYVTKFIKIHTGGTAAKLSEI